MKIPFLVSLSILFISPLSARHYYVVEPVVAPVPVVVTPAPAVLVSPTPVLVQENPPAALVEEIPVSPGEGYTWVKGHWNWEGRWVWHRGFWNNGYYGGGWVPGHWSDHHHHVVWREGHWH